MATPQSYGLSHIVKLTCRDIFYKCRDTLLAFRTQFYVVTLKCSSLSCMVKQPMSGHSFSLENLIKCCDTTYECHDNLNVATHSFCLKRESKTFKSPNLKFIFFHPLEDLKPFSFSQNLPLLLCQECLSNRC